MRISLKQESCDCGKFSSNDDGRYLNKVVWNKLVRNTVIICWLGQLGGLK